MPIANGTIESFLFIVISSGARIPNIKSSVIDEAILQLKTAKIKEDELQNGKQLNY